LVCLESPSIRSKGFETGYLLVAMANKANLSWRDSVLLKYVVRRKHRAAASP
jgi:hypothetical protein